ncbi:hypothetical protein ACWGQ5_14760 [Streptomyces sp. NPDC055722]
MKMRSGSYPPVGVQGDGRGAVSQAGAVLMVETARFDGLFVSLVFDHDAKGALRAGDRRVRITCKLREYP